MDDLFEFLTDRKSKVWLLIFPFKELLFFKKSKYKLVRLFSILSPWLVLPYTVFAWVIYGCAWIFIILVIIFLACINCAKDIFNNLKTFWDNV